MPLTSTKKQDGARFQMREAFPSFLEKHPEQAVRALVAALEGYVESNHKTAAPERHLDVNGKPCVLREDMSHIWASDPEDRYAYANDMASIILAFKSRLESAKNDEALELVSFVAEYNKLAVLWARVFLVAAKRPDVLGLAVWPYASAVPFLRAAETRKDAVDAVAAAYPLLDPAARASFEESIACVVFENVENPNKTKLRFLGTVFQTIGAAKLATDAAKQVVRDTEAAKLSSENRRVRTADVQWRAPEPYWFLEDKGVDVSAPENIELLQLVKELEELISPNSEVPVDVVKAAERLRVLEQALVSASASGASQQVIEYAEDSLVQRCAYLARQKAGLAESQPSIATLRDIVKKYVVHPRPQGGTETSTGPRAYAVEAAFQCAR